MRILKLRVTSELTLDMTAGLWGERLVGMGEGLALLSNPRPPSSAAIETGVEGGAWWPADGDSRK